MFRGSKCNCCHGDGHLHCFDCNRHDDHKNACGCDYHQDYKHDCRCSHHQDYKYKAEYENHHGNKHHKNGCKCCKHNDLNHFNCSCHFCLKLAGLTDNLNYKIFSNCGRSIEVGTIGGRLFKGKPKHAGIDYVDIMGDYNTRITILKDKMEYIKWPKNSRHC